MWRVETRHDVYDKDDFAHTFTGFVEVETLNESEIITGLQEAYSACRTNRVELRYVEAKKR